MLLILLRTCQFWILVLGFPSGHIPEKSLEALDSMFQNSSRVLKKGVTDYYILPFTEHLLYMSDIVLSDITYILLLNPNSLGVSISLFP